MKTAKDIARAAETSRGSGVYVFELIDLEEYFDALCREQRSLCLEAYENDWQNISILNAPQPEGI